MTDLAVRIGDRSTITVVRDGVVRLASVGPVQPIILMKPCSRQLLSALQSVGCEWYDSCLEPPASNSRDVSGTHRIRMRSAVVAAIHEVKQRVVSTTLIHPHKHVLNRSFHLLQDAPSTRGAPKIRAEF